MNETARQNEERRIEHMIVWRDGNTAMARHVPRIHVRLIALAAFAGLTGIFGIDAYSQNQDLTGSFFMGIALVLALSFARARHGLRRHFPILRRHDDLICDRKQVIADALSAVLRVRSFHGGCSTELCAPDGKRFIILSFARRENAVALASLLGTWLDIRFETERKARFADGIQKETAVWPPAPQRPEGRPDAPPPLPEWMEDDGDLPAFRS